MREKSSIKESLEADVKAEKLVRQLILEEKFLLLPNHDKSVYFSSTPVARLGIPSIEMTDGPLRGVQNQGVRVCLKHFICYQKP